jgi:Mrp family chromosome partitioning ATPase
VGRDGDQRDLREYARVVRRHVAVVVLAALLLPAAAVFFSLHQEKRYRASAKVLISRQNLGANLTGQQDTLAAQDPERVIDTQADLARVTAVARRVVEALRVPETPRQFLRDSSVSPKRSSDLLIFRVTAPVPALAKALATEYARQFTIYRRELDTQALERARRDVAERIRALRAAGEQRSALYSNLRQKEQQLRTLEALQGSNAFVVEAADDAVQVQPRPLRNGILGLVLGALLGVGIAFLFDTLDTRARSAEEVGERLGLPLLARLREPPRALRRADRLAMLAEPASLDAEAFRMLRTNVEFANLERQARAILVTSAIEEEGKSTTVANLAVAFARRGLRVVLVDLDLRRPFVHRFFDLDDRPGITDVALGHSELDEALHRIAITADVEPPEAADRNGSGNGTVPLGGVLEVLAAGSIPPDPGEFAGTSALGALLDRLRIHGDLVLIDAPPLLHVGDTLTLSSKVDAIVVVARMQVVRRPMLRELRRLLDACRATKLGFVATAVAGEDGYRYGYRRYYARAAAPVEGERVA